MSLGLLRPRVFTRARTMPALSAACIHKHPASRCRILPAPRLWQIATADESDWTSSTNGGKPRSAARYTVPAPREKALHNPYVSASPDDMLVGVLCGRGRMPHMPTIAHRYTTGGTSRDWAASPVRIGLHDLRRGLLWPQEKPHKRQRLQQVPHTSLQDVHVADGWLAHTSSGLLGGELDVWTAQRQEAHPHSGTAVGMLPRQVQISASVAGVIACFSYSVATLRLFPCWNPS